MGDASSVPRRIVIDRNCPTWKVLQGAGGDLHGRIVAGASPAPQNVVEPKAAVRPAIGVRVVEFREEDLHNSMLLLGFPGSGLVGPVAVSYIVEKLRLTRFAGLYGPDMPPLAIVEDGVAYSPVRFYSGKERCGPGGQCDRLVVGIADVPIEPDSVSQAARAIMRWAKRREISLVVILEGIAGTNVGDAKLPKETVLAVKSATSGQDFARLGVTPVSSGSLSSHAAALLLAGNALAVDVLAMFTTARQDLPDPRAAGVLLRKVDPMLPNLELKPRALERRAVELDAHMRESIKKSKHQLKSLKKTYEMMYH